jgi:hypothetical protein
MLTIVAILGNSLLTMAEDAEIVDPLSSLEYARYGHILNEDTDKTKVDPITKDVTDYIKNAPSNDPYSKASLVDDLDLTPYEVLVENSSSIGSETYVASSRNIKYSSANPEVCNKLNSDVYNIVDRYMSKTSYIPVKDPKWFIALGAVEYGYAYNDPGLVFSWPVRTEDYTEDFMLKYNWKYVNSTFGTSAVTRRSGGAIGPFQQESFYGQGVTPVIPEEFGLIGTDGTHRTDCWIDLGANPAGGTSILWKLGTKADRWSIADSANLCLAVYDTTLRKVNGKCALTNLSDRYAQVTLLMWGHNRGTGILGQENYARRAAIIATYVPEIKEYIDAKKPSRFVRDAETMRLVSKIANAAGSDNYPVMSLISYMITEARYNGEW